MVKRTKRCNQSKIYDLRMKIRELKSEKEYKKDLLEWKLRMEKYQ